MAKGSQFERDVCRAISKWWSGGKHDDLFWRSSMSGGRATVRGKKGKQTAGHYGDITATDNRGRVLTAFIAFEAKKGYTAATIHHMLDRSRNLKLQTYEEFLEQASKAARAGKIPHYMIIHRRTRREVMCFFPEELMITLKELGCWSCSFVEHALLVVRVNGLVYRVVGMRLDSFFSEVGPMDIRAAYRAFRRQ